MATSGTIPVTAQSMSGEASNEQVNLIKLFVLNVSSIRFVKILLSKELMYTTDGLKSFCAVTAQQSYRHKTAAYLILSN